MNKIEHLVYRLKFKTIGKGDIHTILYALSGISSVTSSSEFNERSTFRLLE
jgi:hypothetical protein